jgi:hypothetical protein
LEKTRYTHWHRFTVSPFSEGPPSRSYRHSQRQVLALLIIVFSRVWVLMMRQENIFVIAKCGCLSSQAQLWPSDDPLIDVPSFRLGKP